MHKLAVRLAVDFCVILLVAGGTVFAQFQLTPGSCSSGTAQRWNGTTWSCETVPIGVPAGAVVLIDSGTCPSGYAEDSALSGKTLFGTVAANSDVGTTGGADTITPAGTVAAPAFSGTAGTVPAEVVSWPAGVPTFSGTQGAVPAETIAWPAGVPVFTGSALGTHLHGAGTYANAWPAGVPTFAGTGVAAHAHELPWQIPSTTTIRQIAVATFGTGASRAATAVSAAGTANTTSAAVALSQAAGAHTPAGTVAWPAGVPTISGSDAAITAGTPAGTNAWPAGVPTNGTVNFTPAGSVAWPAGVPTTGTAAFTPAGTNSAPAFTGTNFDNRSAFARVIFCKKS